MWAFCHFLIFFIEYETSQHPQNKWRFLFSLVLAEAQPRPAEKAGLLGDSFSPWCKT